MRSVQYSISGCVAFFLLFVVHATASPGDYYNPSVIVHGGTAQYKIEVDPAYLPDDRIEWQIVNGNVSFVGGNNKGRIVTVNGDSPGDFKLNVVIGGLSSPNGPYIYGMVLPLSIVQLHFFIITSNGVAAVSEELIDIWVDETNRAFKQVAMSFVKASVTPLENPAWFNPANRQAVTNMFSHANNVGGLEVYCVSTLFGGSNTLGTASNPDRITGPARGIAVAAKYAKVSTLAHEIAHACGLEDIMDIYLGSTLVNEWLVGWNNWSGGDGTGYYPRDLKHLDLINRVLMSGSNDRGDIPLGSIRGWSLWDNPGPGQSQNPPIKKVGLNSMNRNPQH